jgi:hypothetical protein
MVEGGFFLFSALNNMCNHIQITVSLFRQMHLFEEKYEIDFTLDEYSINLDFLK